MITYDCYICREEFTEQNPIEWGDNPYFEQEYCCFKCADNYDGPGDEYYEGMAESAACYETRQYEQLQGAGRI